MSNINVIKPKGDLCKLKDCPIGLFLFGDTLGFLSEYTGDIFIVESGEAFWAGTDTPRDRYNVTVQPCEVISESMAIEILVPNLLADIARLRTERETLINELENLLSFCDGDEPVTNEMIIEAVKLNCDRLEYATEIAREGNDIVSDCEKFIDYARQPKLAGAGDDAIDPKWADGYRQAWASAASVIGGLLRDHIDPIRSNDPVFMPRCTCNVADQNPSAAHHVTCPLHIFQE